MIRCFATPKFKGFNYPSVATVSDKNSWNPLTKRCFFFLMVRLLFFPMFFITALKGRKTAKCPNNFDLDCSLVYYMTFIKGTIYSEGVPSFVYMRGKVIPREELVQICLRG